MWSHFWVMYLMSWHFFPHLSSDTTFIKIDQGIQILQLEKDQKFLLFVYYFLNILICIWESPQLHSSPFWCTASHVSSKSEGCRKFIYKKQSIWGGNAKFLFWHVGEVKNFDAKIYKNQIFFFTLMPLIKKIITVNESANF